MVNSDKHSGSDADLIGELWANGVERFADSPARPRDDVRSRHWNFFSEHVLGILQGAVDYSLAAASVEDQRVRDFLMQRLRIRNRFRPSELLYVIAGDVGVSETSHCLRWLSGALELLQFSRLIADDVLDEHTHRWGQPTLWALNGHRGDSAQKMSKMANLTSTMLAHMSSLMFERAEHHGHKEGLLGSESPRWSGLGQEYATRMWACMLAEVSIDVPVALTFPQYARIASRKHCNGALIGELLQTFRHTRPAELREALALSDVAASVANDFSEVNGQRGISRPRVASGEPRGERSEIELGRPNVFMCFTTTDNFARWSHSRSQSVSDLANLANLERDALMDILWDSGCLRYARRERDRLIDQAVEGLNGAELPETVKWVSQTAKIHGSLEGMFAPVRNDSAQGIPMGGAASALDPNASDRSD